VRVRVRLDDRAAASAEVSGARSLGQPQISRRPAGVAVQVGCSPDRDRVGEQKRPTEIAQDCHEVTREAGFRAKQQELQGREVAVDEAVRDDVDALDS